jgi:hypothetical protein
MMTRKEIAKQLEALRNGLVAQMVLPARGWGAVLLGQAIAALEAEPLAEGWLTCDQFGNPLVTVSWPTRLDKSTDHRVAIYEEA